MRTRLLRQGEGAAALSIAAGADAPGATEGRSLQAALDRDGGHVAFPDLPGGAGWCFGVFSGARMVGMLYACSPVSFIQSHALEQRDYLIRSLIEIEVFVMDAEWRGRGGGTALLQHAEQHFSDLGIRVVVAKVDASDMPVLRWYRHRGYTVARVGEQCNIHVPAAVTGINAGDDGQWRLAVKASGRSVVRRLSGLWLEPPLAPE